MPSDKEFSLRLLEHCRENHAQCISPTETWFPTRLLAIYPSASSWNLKLIETHHTPPSGPYVALSHCWGTAPVIKLTSELQSSLMEEVFYSQLPATFQDAITIAGWLDNKTLLCFDGLNSLISPSIIYMD